MLTTLVSFVVLLLILIFVHELGHFLAAKLLGVGVEKFSLGFPPKIFCKKFGETEYQLAWLPLGGYVKLLGEEPGKIIPPEDLHRSFMHKPYWIKAIVVLAGPFFNIFFAIFALWILSWVVGIQHVAPIIGPLDPTSPAAQAGLQINDIVLEVNGQKISYFDEILDLQTQSAGEPLNLLVSRDGLSKEIQITPVLKEGTTLLGDQEKYWDAGFTSRILPIVSQAIPGKPAAAAGLQEMDYITSVNGQPVSDWSEVVKIIRGVDTLEPGLTEHQDQVPEARPIEIKAYRFNVLHTFTITPSLEPSQNLSGETIYTPIIGISPKISLEKESIGPIRAFKIAVTDSWRMASLTVLSLVKLVQAKISTKVMGGPIMIAEVAGMKAREGIADFIWLMAFISVNLAIINLVPLPILDGGQFVIFTIEWIKRKPLNDNVKGISQWIGITALVALMILVFYNDISRLVTRFSGPPTQIERTE
ncbi:MAG: RIP metalloprotease RseP [Deltaproteobacteria bacterium]|nr:RIP metalloprotease RseP [Deltaproteobacteria bacterium]